MTTVDLGANRVRELVHEWRRFAQDTTVIWNGQARSWREHIRGDGFEDEVRLIQPTVFPAFAARFLGFEVGVNLSPEEPGEEGKPDFTPADPVTHPFVFETKGSHKGIPLNDLLDLAQAQRYLVDGRPRIRKVVLTNLVGLRVFELDEQGSLREAYHVRLRDLLELGEHQVLGTASATAFARFVAEFSKKVLTPQEKIDRIKEAHPWEPAFEVTSSAWVIARLDRVVADLQRDALSRLHEIDDPTLVTDEEQGAITEELRLLGSRFADDLGDWPLERFVSAAEGTDARLAVEQYAMHVAYYSATRLLMVRTWEDLGLLEPMLYDGGFRDQMARFDDVVSDVVDLSFRQARTRYRSLFQHSNHYSWFSPSPDVYINVIYELAFTYLGRVDSDVLGEVYERLLARIDRKLLGQYYTPRDIIALIWDLIDLEAAAEEAEARGEVPRIFDIATGSGGFLVEAVARLRRRLAKQLHAGAALDVQDWLNEVSDAVNGVEIQHFSRYLGELNLLVQLAQVVAHDPALRVAPVGVVAADTLSLHEPLEQGALEVVATDQPERARKLKSVRDSGFAMDVACGNPPYIGEALAAPILRRTRQQYPYWEQFVAEHLDYLYWFLIVGISKLRSGGRFGFITTEYWLRSSGARPLREYISRHCDLDRVVLFRDLRLFPDAPGQHSMIVVGTRRTDPGEEEAAGDAVRPLVSIYKGPHLPTPSDRVALLAAIRGAQTAAQVQTFGSQVSPETLGGESWGDVILTRRQLRQRVQLREGEQVQVRVTKGVETTLNALSSRTADHLPAPLLAQLGWPSRKPGIQLLRQEEVTALGTLNDLEQHVLRSVINTKDVFPYAAVLPDEADVVVYLTKPDDLPQDDAAVTAPFPQGMPAIQRHLERFEPVLTRATRDRGERRPWWTLHRPRYHVIGSGVEEGEWEPYCLTTRWGGGNRLVVGVAPARTSPASGLHIMRPVGVDASYLAALYNSSLYQAIVDSLPPGNVRAQELVRLGAPLLREQVEALSSAGIALAYLVRTMVIEEAARFPLLPELLRYDVSLPELPDDVWAPPPGPLTEWGELRNVRWVKDVQVLRAPGERLGEVRVSETLFGHRVDLTRRNSEHVGVSIEFADDIDASAASVLAAFLRGAAQTSTRMRDVPSLLVPTDEQNLVSAYAEDVNRLAGHAATYRNRREEIDGILEGLL